MIVSDILVIEDERDSMEMLCSLLNFHGYETTGVSTAEEALSFLQGHQPSLIIVDLALPGMDGWGFLHTIQANDSLSHIPRIAVTAYHSMMVAQQAIRAGFNAYFAKPIDATTFVQEVREMIA